MGHTEYGACPSEDEMEAEEEIAKLQAINADLLTALKAANSTIIRALDNMPWLTQRLTADGPTELSPEAVAWRKILYEAKRDARAAIQKAENN